MIPAGKLGGRSSRKGEDTQKKKKIKNRATGNINGLLGYCMYHIQTVGIVLFGKRTKS